MKHGNVKTGEDIKKEIAWYQKKLDALDDEKLTIKLVGEQGTLMTIGATVENESFYGVLAVDFVEGIREDLKNKIVSLQTQLATLANRDYNTSKKSKDSRSMQYGLKRNTGPYLKGVFNNITNFFGLF